MGEFETVMQTLDFVSGLHNCQDFPNPSSVYIRLCKHRKKVFYCFYKITLPRKNANSLLRSWLKGKVLPVAKSYTQSLARVISSCFAKRRFPETTDFSPLKCQLKQKKDWHTFFVTTFQLKEWVNKVNLWSFELENFFKFVLAW